MCILERGAYSIFLALGRVAKLKGVLIQSWVLIGAFTVHGNLGGLCESGPWLAVWLGCMTSRTAV